jgi:N-acetylmuramoyl-L-alanine amidase
MDNLPWHNVTVFHPPQFVIYCKISLIISIYTNSTPAMGFKGSKVQILSSRPTEEVPRRADEKSACHFFESSLHDASHTSRNAATAMLFSLGCRSRKARGTQM